MGRAVSCLRYAVGAFSDTEADQWHWFIVGIDSLQQQQYFNLSSGQYSSEDLAFEAGCVALGKLKTKLAKVAQG